MNKPHLRPLALVRCLLSLWVVALWAVALPLHAQTGGVRQSEYMIGVGASNILDTYLSPEQYTGLSLSYLAAHVRQGYDAEKGQWQAWTHKTTWSGRLHSTSNRTGSANYLGGHVGFRYEGLYSRIPYFRFGPMAEASVGGLYNTRNGNNPAQFHALANIGVALATGKDFQLFGKDFRVAYQASLPLLGLAFSPQYGQSYYEIFTRGNYDHNLVLTSPLNAFSFSHLLSLDAHLRKHTFRIGLLGDYRQREANHLKFHDYSHLIVLGYLKNFSINP